MRLLRILDPNYNKILYVQLTCRSGAVKLCLLTRVLIVAAVSSDEDMECIFFIVSSASEECVDCVPAVSSVPDVCIVLLFSVLLLTQVLIVFAAVSSASVPSIVMLLSALLSPRVLIVLL